MAETVTIAAAIVLDAAGRMLVVRKRGTTAFMQPGGKIEPGEAPAAALARELREEVQLAAGEPVALGVFSAPAANEPGTTVVAHAFAVTASEAPRIAAEIEEAAWVDPLAPGEISLAPLTRDHMLALAQSLRSRAVQDASGALR